MMTEQNKWQSFSQHAEQQSKSALREASSIDFFAGWQAALKGGEPVAYATPDIKEILKIRNGVALVSEKKTDLHTVPLYTSPPNTKYTEAEVDEMMMKVAKEVYEATVEDRDGKYCKKDFRAIVDKVKAG